MRIAFVLVLLLAASARPAAAQHAHLQPAQQPLPASLTPGVPSAGPFALELRRDHWKGALIGAAVGAVAGATLAFLHVCADPLSDVNVVCYAGMIGLGTVVGAIVGGLVGAPDPG
jgi:hypothetical protein